MPPKKSESAAPKAKSAATHPSYQDMITSAIISLKERNGSSRMKLKKYVKANNNVGNVGDKMFDALFNKALKNGVEKGVFEQPKGPSGGTKLAKKAPAPKKESEKPPVKKAAPKKEPAKKEPEKKETKKPAAKKAAPKKEPAKKETKKPAAAKPAAAKKAAPKKAAPAVVEKPTVLSKTKSGRVTKTAKPVADKKKKTPTKKATAPTPKKKEAAA